MTYTFREWYIPDRMMDGIQRYLDHGIAPGGFMLAVLENDLMGACQQADEENIRNLPAYCAYLYNEMPSASHGSRTIVNAWMKNHRLTMKEKA